MPALDGVRGVAIALVLLFHGLSTNGATPASLVERAWYALWSLGHSGVDVFFVLSGFLITRALIATTGTRNYFRTFYARRSLRIFPAYFVWLALAGIVVVLNHAAVRTWFVAQHWLYIENWFALAGQVPDSESEWALFGHLWSLAVEEQFYLLWPALLLLLNRRLTWLAVAIILATPLVRLAGLAMGLPPYGIYTNTPFRLDGLCLGALLAMQPRVLSWIQRYAVQLLICAAVFLIAVRVGARFVADTAAAIEVTFHSGVIVVAAVMVAIAVDPAPRIQWLHSALSSNPLRVLGKYSYGIYLLHWPIMVGCKQFFVPFVAGLSSAIVAHLIFLAATGVLIAIAAAIMWTLVEQPFLKFKERFTG